MRKRMMTERMIRITALVMVISIGFLVPKAAAQSYKISALGTTGEHLGLRA
jgi:hypothetical protein